MERAIIYRHESGQLVLANVTPQDRVQCREMDNVSDEKLSQIDEQTGVVVELDDDMGALANLAHIRPLFSVNFFTPAPTAHECMEILMREPERLRQLLTGESSQNTVFL